MNKSTKTLLLVGAAGIAAYMLFRPRRGRVEVQFPNQYQYGDSNDFFDKVLAWHQSHPVRVPGVIQGNPDLWGLDTPNLDTELSTGLNAKALGIDGYRLH